MQSDVIVYLKSAWIHTSKTNFLATLITTSPTLKETKTILKFLVTNDSSKM